jgi:acetyl-CoA carboxylase, biotin carboxylase subunit
MEMLESVLIANRGEIACRIIRTARQLGMRTIAVYSEADADALFVQMADEAHLIGPPPARESYLRIDRIIEVAKRTKAASIHPGYGFLSERAEFAEACAANGIVLVGPPASAIKAMGLKDAAKTLVQQAGAPVVPGYHGSKQDPGFLRQKAYEIGYPVLIKAVAGGGGKGMRRVEKAADFDAALESAQREAQNSFGDPRVLVEKYILSPRHIEIQVFADGHGNVLHLFERDCSLQRRHQKVWEEGPSPALNASERKRIGEVVAKAMQQLEYAGVGTVEFLYEGGEFYFIEMNTRIQVEHPVTEMVTGIDLLNEQIRVAAGSPMSLKQADVLIEGHAIECRINAEHPATFRPSPGQITYFHPPGGLGVRVDSAVYQGYTIPPFYDSLVGKLIVHGRTRNECMMRLRRSLDEFVVDGIDTTLPLFRRLVRNPDIQNGQYDIHWLETFLEKGANEEG